MSPQTVKQNGILQNYSNISFLEFFLGGVSVLNKISMIISSVSKLIKVKL